MAATSAYPTSFVGREGLLTELDEPVGQGARLVTIGGGPGIGTSRLATGWALLWHQREEPTATVFIDISVATGVDDPVNMIGDGLTACGVVVHGALSDCLGKLGPVVIGLDHSQQ